MINIKQLKDSLTINDIISLMSELDADYNSINDSEIHFKSICHESNSYKLYYYVESQNFYCHRCAEQWDIFSLIQHVKDCNFVDALNFVCGVLHIDSAFFLGGVVRNATSFSSAKAFYEHWAKGEDRFLDHHTRMTVIPDKIWDVEDAAIFYFDHIEP